MVNCVGICSTVRKSDNKPLFIHHFEEMVNNSDNFEGMRTFIEFSSKKLCEVGNVVNLSYGKGSDGRAFIQSCEVLPC